MNRKMIRLAFGAKCGARMARGFLESMGVSAARSMSANAIRPKPLADRRSMSRRVKAGLKRKQPAIDSLHKHEFAAGKQDLAKGSPGADPAFRSVELFGHQAL